MRNTLLVILALGFTTTIFAQQNNGKMDVAQRVNNAANKVTSIIAVFQPYLLKARQLYYDAKQIAGDVRNTAKNTFGKNKNPGATSGYSNC